MNHFFKEVFKPISNDSNVTSQFLYGISFVVIVVSLITFSAILWAVIQ